MKIENYIVICLIVFFKLSEEKITTLRITNLNSNFNLPQQSNINISPKNEAINPISNENGNNSNNFPLTPIKVQPPTFNSAYIDKPNTGIYYYSNLIFFIFPD